MRITRGDLLITKDVLEEIIKRKIRSHKRLKDNDVNKISIPYWDSRILKYALEICKKVKPNT